MERLSDEQRAEVEREVKGVLGQDATPQAREEAFQAKVTSMMADYAKAARKKRQSERCTLISKIDALTKLVRHERQRSPKRLQLEAQIKRAEAKLQVVLQQLANDKAKQYEQQRWRREMGDNKALFDTIKPDRAITLPADRIRIPTFVDLSGKQHYREAHGQEEVMQAAVNHWQGLFNVGADEGASWQPEVAAKDAFLKQMEQDPKCHLSPEHAEKLRPENMFSCSRLSDAAIRTSRATPRGHD